MQGMTSRNNSNSFLLALFGFEKAKSKAYILLIILIHATGWCILFFLPVLLYPVRINDGRFVVRELIDKSVLVILFYLNYYFLIPRFFEKKKYIIYSSFVTLLFFLYLFQHIVIRVNYFPRPRGAFQFVQVPIIPSQGREPEITEYSFNNENRIVIDEKLADDSAGKMLPSNKPIPAGDTPGRMIPGFKINEPLLFGIPKGVWLVTLNNAITSFALLLLLGGFFRLAYSFIRSQNEKKALENANLNAEVNFLKSQINPHFLFNTLNGIYSQAHNKSEHTEYSILKLSDLLRYVLYDSGENKVDLVKDIRYLTNYIELQELRLSKKVKINYEVTGEPEGKQIAPLLLITFVENAFKHGISYTNPSTININIEVFEKILTLVVSNPITETNSFVGNGLGLKNVRRRLDLIYPGKYLLDIVHNDHLHIVNLKINLDND
jgi:two-component system, LytTR family, sensor kinase